MKVRPATAADIPWVRALLLDSCVYTVSEFRDLSNEKIREQRAAAQTDLEGMLTRTDFVILIADEAGQQTGYLILQFDVIESTTGEPQAYIYDIAVAPEHWGSKAYRALMLHAIKLAAWRGYRFLSGTITASNRRSLLAAQRLGCQIERYEMVVGCSLQGPVPMPGRPEEERSHAQSRKVRPRKKTPTRPESSP